MSYKYGKRQVDGYLQAGVGIARGDCAVVQSDCAHGDRQAQAHAAGGAFAGIVDTEERLEDLIQRVLRHTGTVIPYGDAGCVRGACEFDFDRGIGRRIADGIAEHVLQRAAQAVTCGGFVVDD